MSSDRKIYVGNLPPETTVKDIEKLFSSYGKILEIDVKNRNGPPFAFLTYDDRRDAEDAVHERDGYDYDGFSLRVEFPRDPKRHRKESTHRYPRYDNMSSYVPQFDPYDMYMPFNYHPYQNPNQYNYYGDYRNNGGMNGKFNHSNRFGNNQRKPRPLRTNDYRMWISNLPDNTNWQDLKDFMRKYGEVSYTDILPNGKAVVDFVSKHDFRYVLKHSNNIKFKSPTKIYI